MKKIKQKISTGFQLHLKWVRFMLILSTIIIVTLVFIPTKKLSEPPISESKKYEFISETQQDTVTVQQTMTPYTKNVHRSADRTKHKEPFDWKGTITWAIGAINGLILVALNIKNLFFKKNS